MLKEIGRYLPISDMILFPMCTILTHLVRFGKGPRVWVFVGRRQALSPVTRNIKGTNTDSLGLEEARNGSGKKKKTITQQWLSTANSDGPEKREDAKRHLVTRRGIQDTCLPNVDSQEK